MNKTNKVSIGPTLIYIFFSIYAIICLIPFIAVVSISLSGEKDIVDFGYSLIPKNVDLSAYRYIFSDPTQLIRSYEVTIFVTVIGTILSVLFMAMIAYALSRSSFKYKSPISFYIFFTMLFNGGLAPTYILITQYLHMADTIWVLIVPGLINAWHIILLRTFFQKMPESIIESAKMDGASEMRVFFQFMLPLSTPALATVAFLGAMGRWNDWFTALLYINKPELMPLQYLLQRMLSNIQFMQQLMDNMPAAFINADLVPSESARMAMAVVAAGPMLVVFPFFQKYFVEGLTVGSVKG
ncbi:carbohydrate ABC transporter permease [Mahella australiensis]|uniref:Binding-protein-dependent transport systems inner membrane component n=1 Tax=Mahella australiensis (strain DSM 15567 / CIP 107919 / 50-1 BON) TaxID=697281 RepID=F3ZYP1_MAHA5|nr:carbohydrate ABC transporter permease [Mahella australiensis]AEE97809.1 binding-protein-dependent transport systems inner membrane component [Mahella australiensis 50-1 BON]